MISVMGKAAAFGFLWKLCSGGGPDKARGGFEGGREGPRGGIPGRKQPGHGAQVIQIEHPSLPFPAAGTRVSDS